MTNVRKWLLASLSALTMGLGLPAGTANAYVAPVHGAVSAYGYGGNSASHGAGDSDADAGAGPLAATAGSAWWCETPGCGVSLGPNAGSGWSSVRVDPGSGEIRARAGAMNQSHSAVGWDISVPWGSGTIHYVPGFWGESVAEAYLRRSWRLVATDPEVLAGSPVSVTGSLALTGEIQTGDITSAIGGLLLNTAELANAKWLAGTEAINVHSLFELVVVDPEVASRTFSVVEPGPIAISESLDRTFAVGDIVVMESLLRVTAAVRNEGIPREVWVDLDDTLHSAIVVNTPGVTLVPVPEPSSWVLMAVGIGVLGRAIRRRRG